MIMKILKNETKSHHADLEALPYFKTLIDHKLPLECCVSQLQALAVIHGVMENEIPASGDERVLAVWDDDMRKLPLLEQDLAFFAPRIAPDDVPSRKAALAMTKQIRLRRIENPVTLLGYLYVFEGSTLGNRIHKPDMKAMYQSKGNEGCRYYSSYGDQVKAKWQRFTEVMDRELSDPSLHEPIIEAAQEAFSGLQTLYKALYPLSQKEKSYHVTRINPEAGDHPIPDDEREIQAALKASDRTWAEFPYYEHRYGQRGKRFSDSDTCWLATLADLDPDTVQNQITWIGRVLATRGMPRLMLAHTLRNLYEELASAVPDKAPSYEKLLSAADVLEEERKAIIPDTAFRSLSEEFNGTVGHELAHTHRNAVDLLLSAVADERSGIQAALPALRDWMTDPNRFPERWIAAVNAAIDKERRAAASTPKSQR